jgi:hypothetical protein
MPGRLPNSFVVKFNEFHKLTRWQRWKILCGFNLTTESTVVVHCRNGSAKTKCVVALTPEQYTPDQIKADVTATATT